eukprot:10096844-Alexandrium_andersonii.AAC.1
MTPSHPLCLKPASSLRYVHICIRTYVGVPCRDCAHVCACNCARQQPIAQDPVHETLNYALTCPWQART